jgi:hypothetical protein
MTKFPGSQPSRHGSTQKVCGLAPTLVMAVMQMDEAGFYGL